jgi:hypothetical protein
MARNTATTGGRGRRGAGGVPRTHRTAERRGYEPARHTFEDLSDEQKAHFVQFEGGAAGAVCGVAPSPDPNFWLVCYKDQNGQCNWVSVPRGAPPSEHG